MRVQQLRVLSLIALVSLVALLSLAYPDLTEFRREEAWALLKATDMVSGRGIPLTGIETSVPGLDNGPLQSYITSIGLLSWHNVSFVAGLYALLTIGALPVASRLSALAFGQSAMFFTVAAYAVGSWPVYFSRSFRSYQDIRMIWQADLDPGKTQLYHCVVIPSFDASGDLPPGIHWATWTEVVARFGSTQYRMRLASGLLAALESLRRAGCRTAYIDGSFISEKEVPGDFDACWDPIDVDPHKLDPVLLIFDYGRAAQKAKFLGELFPTTLPADVTGSYFLEFFQRNKNTGERKGIVAIDLGGLT